MRASKPGKRCKTAYKSGDVEMYDHDRFFTVTNAIVGDIKDVADGHEQIAALYAEVFCKRVHSTTLPPETVQSTPLSDDEIIRLASSSRRKNGVKFSNLFEGNWNAYFNSPSEADSSVCWTLAYYRPPV